ncbi:pheromone receptor [Lentinula raphanica]|uniref:Pheromone receptor n=1 Tax=Lentinula raphanica TaxID=153919 RepID=A0AA38NY89_9AGAR|nr:pheromone receptor [Lentinula raphanica]
MANLDYPLFPIFAFFGFFLPLIPLPWHFQAWNSGTCFYIFWASLSCLNQFVNSLIWRGNVINSAPVWCEISIRITMATTVALPAASFCIVRRLYGIAAIRSASISYAQKRRAVIIDSLICGLWPLVYVALQYIVQGHRFNIYEDIGCMPALYNTIPTYFITFSWVLLFGIGSAVYCVLSLYAFAQRRLEFAQFMSTNKTLSFGRYFRLMALAMTEMICTVPLTILLIWLSATQSPVQPWISLANTHLDYSRVDQYPSVIYNANPLFVLGILFTRWASVACALIFFAFFGFAEEARRHYVLWYRAILRFAGIKSSETTNRVSLKADPPFKMIPTSPLPKHDSPSAEPFYPPPPAYTRGSLSISPSKSSVSDFSSTICPSPASQDYFKSLDGDVLFGHAV